MVTAFKDQVVPLAELSREHGTLKEMIFERCVIMGPAVIANSGGPNQYRRCAVEHPQVFWPIVPDPGHRIFGCVLTDACLFEDCTFVRVAILGPPEWCEIARTGGDFEAGPPNPDAD